MQKEKEEDGFTEEEAQGRFLAAVKAALNTPPRPQKSRPRKGVAAQSKRRKKPGTP
jgi:hypothetical protein